MSTIHEVSEDAMVSHETPVIDEIDDHGIILEDGYPLTFVDLCNILTELRSTLRSLPGIRDAINVDHTNDTFREAARILKVMAEVKR